MSAMIQKVENEKVIIYLLWFNLIAFSTTCYLLYNSILTDYMPILFLAIFLITISVYFLFRKKEEGLFRFDNGYLIINQTDDAENIRLTCEDIKFFETRFNEIIIHRNDNEKFCVKLDKFKSNKERWELKEFLRNHITENRGR